MKRGLPAEILKIAPTLLEKRNNTLPGWSSMNRDVQTDRQTVNALVVSMTAVSCTNRCVRVRNKRSSVGWSGALR